jgi:hypothetical protein
MQTCIRFASLLLLLACAVPASAAESTWTALRVGMTRAQVAQIVGSPVLQNAGRGHETWIYDAGASVQFRGGVVSAWTAPRKATASTV